MTGGLRDDLATEVGLRRGLPVAAGGGDNAAAAVGVGVVREGAVSTSIGTSGVLFAHRDAFSPDPSGRVHAFCHARAGRLAPDGCHAVFGRLAELVARPGRRRLRHARRRGRGGAARLRGPDLPPVPVGERTPHLDPHARGAFVGLTLATAAGT